MSATPSNNPVFDYRAGFRAIANRVQKWMLLGGLLLSLIGTFGLLVAKPSDGPYCLPCVLKISIALGAFLFVAGIAWGFYWRKKIRDEFRAKFGPGAPPQS